MKTRSIYVKKSVIENILFFARSRHPKEGILLLKGSSDKYTLTVEDVELPPFSIGGYGFSSFPLHMLPADFSVVGTAHSHPSGNLTPSNTDMNKFYGRIMIITAYPYRSKQDIAVYNRKGYLLTYELIGDSDSI